MRAHIFDAREDDLPPIGVSLNPSWRASASSLGQSARLTASLNALASPLRWATEARGARSPKASVCRSRRCAKRSSGLLSDSRERAYGVEMASLRKTTRGKR